MLNIMFRFSGSSAGNYNFSLNWSFIGESGASSSRMVPLSCMFHLIGLLSLPDWLFTMEELMQLLSRLFESFCSLLCPPFYIFMLNNVFDRYRFYSNPNLYSF